MHFRATVCSGIEADPKRVFPVLMETERGLVVGTDVIAESLNRADLFFLGGISVLWAPAW